MTDAAAPPEEAPAPPATPASPRPVTALAIAGLASLGAGAIHATAIGVHNEHQSVVVTFALVAAFQLAWGAGALALRSSPRGFLALGALGQGAIVAGWLLTKTTGIGFITGLDQSESVQLADGVAAALALVAVTLAVRELLVPAGRSRSTRQFLLPLTALPVAALAVASMVSVDSHSHAGSEHGHTDEAVADHAHGGDDAAHEAAANLGPFDPEETIDLSGVPGVSPEQEEQAEDLLRRTLDRLPQFSDISTLNDKGYYSIGDAVTTDEHYINWSYVNDDKILDPDYPESLVIRHEDGKQYLAAAMFMLPDGTTLDEVPDVGGPLIQWHVHADLCFTDDPVKPTLAFANLIVSEDQECTPPNSKRANVPMIHTWIVPHPCGPFAALEGLGGGQIAEDEEKVCTAEHAHATES